MENSKDIEGLTFNETLKDLSCETFSKDLKRCSLPKSHFDGEKSGNYFIKHSNHFGNKSTNYEGFPVKVILNEAKFKKASFP